MGLAERCRQNKLGADSVFRTGVHILGEHIEGALRKRSRFVCLMFTQIKSSEVMPTLP
jgi:hypothetical protein